MNTSTIKLNDTGERVRYFAKQSWQKIYYSFDHQLTWHPSKSKALNAARESGYLAVIDKPMAKECIRTESQHWSIPVNVGDESDVNL